MTAGIRKSRKPATLGLAPLDAHQIDGAATL
jgi:hypothetical protein